MIKKFTAFYLITLLLLCLGNDKAFAARSKTAQPSSFVKNYILKNPEVFDLGLGWEMLRGKFQSKSNSNGCHTQGLQILDDRIIISCVLYDKKRRHTRSYEATGLLLQAKLSDVLSNDRKRKIHWEIKDITFDVPQKESERISKFVFGNGKKPDNADKLKYRMGHPSGMALSKDGKRVWIAPSVYGPRGYTSFVIYDPESGQFESHNWTVPYHSGAVVELDNDIIVGFTWGSKEFIALDTRTGKYELYDNRLPEMLDYQDCQYLGENTILCSGSFVLPTKRMDVKIGRAHLIRVRGTRYDDLDFELTGMLEMQMGDKKRTTQSLGLIECGDVKGKGHICLSRNEYGAAFTYMNLTHEGMSFGPDKRYLYFIPDDIPNAKLIRYEVARRQ